MKNNTFIQKYLKSIITKDDVVCDMTLGNGNDSYYLSSLAKKVYGFDINPLAIERSKDKLIGVNNVSIINDSHFNFDLYVNEKIKLFIFNLGYLPNANEDTITKADITLETFKKAYEYLDSGYIVITFYIGHLGGLDEYYILDKYICDNNIVVLEKYREYKKDLEPITYIIKKDLHR